MKYWAERVHITGAYGSGVSTLGSALASSLGCRHFETEDYHWIPTDPPFQQKWTRAERVRRILAAIHGTETWVLSGSLDPWGDSLIVHFDLVIFLYAPTDVRLTRLWARQIERFGEAALSPEGSMFHTHQAFMTMAAQYDDGPAPGRRSLVRHEQWLAKLAAPVLRLEGTYSTMELVKQVLSYTPSLPDVTGSVL
jgi:adenylate kinase family enzyme